MKKKPIRIAIVVSSFNSHITDRLRRLCEQELIQQKVNKKHISVVWVPGGYELPYAAHRLAKSKKFNAVIALGCIIKGQTSHDQHIAQWASLGLGFASLLANVPILFGVLTPNNEKQALTRSKPGKFNRGKEVAEAAMQMIRFQMEKI